MTTCDFEPFLKDAFQPCALPCHSSLSLKAAMAATQTRSHVRFVPIADIARGHSTRKGHPLVALNRLLLFFFTIVELLFWFLLSLLRRSVRRSWRSVRRSSRRSIRTRLRISIRCSEHRRWKRPFDAKSALILFSHSWQTPAPWVPAVYSSSIEYLSAGAIGP